MVFSLFSKSKTSRTERDKDTLLGESLPGSTGAGSGGRARPAESLAEVRKRQAEMAAKIDAIESEMTAEFPPIHHSARKTSTPVPSGVDVPESVKREPGAGGFVRGSSAVSPNLQTFISTNFSTDIFTTNVMQVGAFELSESSSLSPLVEEIAILFANGQLIDCALALREELARNPEVQVSWLLLFEVLQQTNNLNEFESLALDYSVRFESSPPAWRDFQRDQGIKKTPITTPLDPAEVALPARMTADHQKELEAFRKLLKPGAHAKLNFDKLNEVDEAGANVLRELLSAARKNVLPITISGATQAAFALRSKLVINVAQPPDSVWLATLDLYHLLGWQRQFEDLAVDYAVTFEVSPPSYQPPPQHIHITGSLNAESPVVSDTCFAIQSAPQLKGDILGSASEAIATLEAAASLGDQVEVDCSLMGRVDFSAAGSLLNWLLSAHSRGKHISLTQVHVLASALFTVVGINSVADIAARRN